MNAINPEKLHHRKWTAVQPRHKEKHFLVTKLVRDEEETVVEVILEAIYTRRATTLPWRPSRTTPPGTWAGGDRRDAGDGRTPQPRGSSTPA